MELFLIKIPKKQNKIENHGFQSECTKYFVEYLGKKFYNEDFILKKESSGKPYLKNNYKNISISHSNNIVGILISKSKIGLDIEYIKKRDFKKIAHRLNFPSQEPGETDFYKFWTKFEAEFKSGIKKNILNFTYKNYMHAISSDSEIKPDIYEIIFETKNIHKLDFKNDFVIYN